MSRSTGSVMPPDLVARLMWCALESDASKVVPIVTVDPAGWPHPALPSYFEVVAKDSGRVRLATYGSSTTSANLRRAGKLTLVVIDERIAYYVKGRAVELAPAMRATGWNAAFECHVDQVLIDEADEAREPGAYIVSGVTYHNPQRATELARARAVLAELLE